MHIAESEHLDASADQAEEDLDAEAAAPGRIGELFKALQDLERLRLEHRVIRLISPLVMAAESVPSAGPGGWPALWRCLDDDETACR